jgi:hypothetical protein
VPAFLASVLTFETLIVSGLAQSDGTNPSMEGAGQSGNQTGEDIQQGASGVGSKITEGTKDLAGSIGEKLQDLGK